MGRVPESHSHEPDEARLAELAGAYADALVSGDEIAAELAIREAMDSEMDTTRGCPTAWCWTCGRDGAEFVRGLGAFLELASGELSEDVAYLLTGDEGLAALPARG